MTTATFARDALCAFYAAHPDIENADGNQFLALPDTLTAELDSLLFEAVMEKAINKHVAQCTPCREFGSCVTFLPDGTIRCDYGSEDGWDGRRYDNQA